MQKIFLIFISIFILIGCSTKVEQINYNKDVCAYCGMMITDRKFGAELITKKGKIFKYDSIECLAAYTNEIEIEEPHSLWFADFSTPGVLIQDKESKIIRSDEIQSPMGLSFLAVKKNMEENRTNILNNTFKEIKWGEVKEIVKAVWEK